MAFHTFVSGTVAYATEMNDNYYWVGQGTRLPYGGASLEATTAVCNLGTTTARWNNVYCYNIDISGTITSTTEIQGKIAGYLASGAVSRVEITGLNGDAANSWDIYCFWYSDTVTVYTMTINGDSSTSYYYRGMYYTYGGGGTEQGNYTASANFIVGRNGRLTTTSLLSYSKNTLYLKTGIEHMITSQILDGAATDTIHAVWLYDGIFTVSAATIASLVFEASVANKIMTGSEISIYGSI